MSTSTSWLRLLPFWTKINFKKNNFLAKHSTFLDLQSNCLNKKRTVFEFTFFLCWNSESLKFFWKVDEILRVSILNIFQCNSVFSSLNFWSFYPLWAYWACFAPGSATRHSFLLLSQYTVTDAPPWGTWLWTFQWWRKAGKVRSLRRIKPCTQRDSILHLADYKACAQPLCYNWGLFFFNIH